MRDETVARNYAETLFDLALRHGALHEYEEGIGLVADLLDADPSFRLFLETPRISDSDRKEVLRKAFATRLPTPLLHFLLITVDKHRQRLLRDIARQYRALVDEHEGREHVEVTVARAPDDEDRTMLAERLSALLGRQAIPHVRVRPEILGGLIVRSGDTLYDGSLRRRLEDMRRRLLQAPLPGGSEA